MSVAGVFRPIHIFWLEPRCNRTKYLCMLQFCVLYFSCNVYLINSKSQFPYSLESCQNKPSFFLSLLCPTAGRRVQFTQRVILLVPISKLKNLLINAPSFRTLSNGNSNMNSSFPDPTRWLMFSNKCYLSSFVCFSNHTQKQTSYEDLPHPPRDPTLIGKTNESIHHNKGRVMLVTRSSVVISSRLRIEVIFSCFNAFLCYNNFWNWNLIFMFRIRLTYIADISSSK